MAGSRAIVVPNAVGVMWRSVSIPTGRTVSANPAIRWGRSRRPTGISMSVFLIFIRQRDIGTGGDGEPEFPVPWADRPDTAT